MKIGVVTFNSNCDMDMVHALATTSASTWCSSGTRQDLQGVEAVTPGGFSYGDYLRSGAIALLRHGGSRVVCQRRRPRDGGRNGFQILCEAGLLPGHFDTESRKFICRNVHLKPVSRTAVSAGCDTDAFGHPHRPRRRQLLHWRRGLKALEDNDQILFQYCDENCKVNAMSNPSGAPKNIAGVQRREERVWNDASPRARLQHDLANSDGRLILWVSRAGARLMEVGVFLAWKGIWGLVVTSPQPLERQTMDAYAAKPFPLAD